MNETEYENTLWIYNELLSLFVVRSVVGLDILRSSHVTY